MASDVLITPASGLIQFSSSAGSGSGQIKVDGDDLVVSNVLGDVLLGDGASDVFIGNGTDNVDIVFEQNGEIRDDASGKSITLGSKTTNILISGSNTIAMQKGGGNVGIGKTAATKTLEVEGDISGSGTGSFSGGRFTGNVGIGTTSPDNPLHISYNSSTVEGSIQNNTGAVGLQIENTNASGVAAIHLRSADADGYIMYDDSGVNAGDFYFKTDGQDGASVLTLLDGGNVGIGTESPLEKLHVGGNITSSGNITAVSMSGDGSGLTGVSSTLPSGVVSNSAQIADVTLTTAAQTNITSLGTLTTLTVDDITINGSTISDGGAFDINVGGDITLDAAGKDINLTDGSGTAEFIFNLEDAPELDVDGDFTIDGSGLIKLDSATNIVDLVGNVTASGDISSSGNIIGELTGIGGAVTGITSLLATDIKIGEDDETKIDFETANEIHFYANNVEQVYLADNIFGPQSDSDVDLGASGVRWKDSYFDTVTTRNLTTTGPTTIGDGNDVIQFNPRILVQGDVTASGNFITQGNITASGDISSSGTITANSFVGNLSSISNLIANDGANRVLTSDNDGTLSGETAVTINGAQVTMTGGVTANDNNDDAAFQIKGSSDDNLLIVNPTSNDRVGIGTDTPPEKLTVQGNISASGDIFIGESILSSSGNYLGNRQFNKTSTTDADHSGDIVYFGGTTSMDAGKIYAYGNNGAWNLSDADHNNLSGSGLLGVALGAASDINGMLLRGTVTLDHDPGAVGDVLYLSTTAGQATSTVPSGNTDIARVVGYCLDASNGQIWFNPDNTFVEVSA